MTSFVIENVELRGTLEVGQYFFTMENDTVFLRGKPVEGITRRCCGRPLMIRGLLNDAFVDVTNPNRLRAWCIDRVPWWERLLVRWGRWRRGVVRAWYA